MVRRLLRRLLLLWYRLGTRSGGSVSLRETLPIEASGEASQQAIPDMTSKPNMPPATRTALAATRSPWQGVVAWVLLDWAGSAFSTLSITLLVAYFERVVFETNPWGLPGGVVWAWTLAFAMLVTALVAPLWAAWADRHRSLRTSLLMSVLLGSGACVLLGVIPPTSKLAVALLVVAAMVGFDLSAIFTGSHTGPNGPVPPTGKRANSDYVYVMKMEAGLVRHMTKVWNDGWALQQLGWA